MTAHLNRTNTLIATLLLLLAALTAAVMSHSPLVTLDATIEQYLFSIRTPSLLSFFSLVTHLGDTAVVGGITALLLCFFVYHRYKTYAFMLLITVLGAAGTGYSMKALVERARPASPISYVVDNSFAFPSGHAVAAMALYGFVAYYLWHALKTPSQKWLAITVFALIIVLVGFSRLYLGMHFPSDVLAGYLVGTLWLVVGVSFLRDGSKVSQG